MIQSLIATFFRHCIDFIIPQVCGYCKDVVIKKQVLCLKCLASILPIVSVPLVITKTRMLSVFAISDYQYPLRALVQAKNYKNRCASLQLGDLIWNHTALQFAEFDIIVPVPLHWTRYARRWFNQSHEIAKVLSKKSGKPIVQLLIKNKKTVSQSELSRQDRQKNIKEVFSLSKNALTYKKKRILLVDDVMTTGATLQSACHALLSLRPLSLSAAVACRVIHK